MMVVTDWATYTFYQLNHVLAHMSILIKRRVDVIALTMGNRGTVRIQVTTRQVVLVLCRGEFVTGTVLAVIDNCLVEKIELKLGDP